MIDADADAAGVRADVVDSIRNGFAEFLVDEVMDVDINRAAFRPIVASRILVFADQFFLPGVGIRARDLLITNTMSGRVIVDLRGHRSVGPAGGNI